MIRVEVIPRHLIDADREHGLKFRVKPLLNQFGHEQFVDVEGGGVPEVEDQRVAEWVGSPVEGLIIGQGLQQGFVDIKACVEIVADLLAFLVGIPLVQLDGPRAPQ